MRLKEYMQREIQTRPGESSLRIWGKILLEPSFNAVYLLRQAQLTNSKLLRWIYKRKLVNRYGIFVGRNSKIAPGLTMGHPNSIIIGEGTVIGKNCTIYQQTTIGRKDAQTDAYPIIGDNVTIYAGAKIIGAVRIGDNVEIGANAVVTKDCPSDCVLKGVPATWTRKKSST